MEYILVTGGTGFIGSHTVVYLLNSGYNVIIVDNLINSDISVLNKIAQLSGISDMETDMRLVFNKIDLETEYDKLQEVFNQHKITAVIHFAGLKAVGESVKLPLKYYKCNLISTLNLVQAMDNTNCRRLIFSSSATVYGTQPCKTSDSQMENHEVIQTPPIDESMEIGRNISNPYGQTKYMIEQILKDLARSDKDNPSKTWDIISLRYFNPIGSHPSGLLGENPKDIPNNLMPYLIRVAEGQSGYPFLGVFGNDYCTVDGTGVRDYIHVIDLAEGHISALRYLLDKDVIEKVDNRYEAINLGTGKGTSVLELISTYEKVNGVKINYKFMDRRPGDAAEVYADNSKARRILNWAPKLGLDDMCKRHAIFTDIK